MKLRSICCLGILQFTLTYGLAAESPPPARDGSHDFDFLIGNWKAHVRRLPDRLVGSNNWIEYNGISNHKKLLDSNANFEEFESTILTSTYTSKPKQSGSTIQRHTSGASIFWIWIKVFCRCRQLSANSMETGASFTIRNNTRDARFLCATPG